ncbi:hypothetical protein [Bradyrhizobium sp. Ai1a-2]|uniref:hypothetical protein n=1 Tax=Bradyrhizobium sp. Ai1a-2 TaxID=196490 RepID=UPI00040A03BD|nr:hypothetical protein [Bradyrhizobium sp. Ai1a-2]
MQSRYGIARDRVLSARTNSFQHRDNDVVSYEGNAERSDFCAKRDGLEINIGREFSHQQKSQIAAFLL